MATSSSFRSGFLAAILLLWRTAVCAQDLWAQADMATRRLVPAAFPDLPATLRGDLERRGCTIPQVWDGAKPGNVIRGHFRTRQQLDWAVLCSVERVSTILVYRAGRSDAVDELARAPDEDFLQSVGGDRIGFSRSIAVVDGAFIRQAFQWYGGPEPTRLDHEGINDAFVDKASIVQYWYQGAWRKLTGAD